MAELVAVLAAVVVTVDVTELVAVVSTVVVADDVTLDVAVLDCVSMYTYCSNDVGQSAVVPM